MHLFRLCASEQYAGIMMHQTLREHSMFVAVMSTHDSLFATLCGVNMRE
jgi:hypothetical protein